jgi:hypothetical protein
MIAGRSVLALIPNPERQRLIAEYVDQGGGLAMFEAVENAAFLDFLVPRLPDPSHALSLCRMGQALARARLAAETFVEPEGRTARAGIECEMWGRIEREAWECIRHAVQGRVEPDAWNRIERDVWECVEIDVEQGTNLDVWYGVERDAKGRIEREVWRCVEHSVRFRIGCGPHASLLWFHADPDLVLQAAHGAPPPPIGAPAFPMLFAPGLPNLCRAATAEEAALWARLPADDAAPELIERLVAEGVVVWTE